MKFKSIAALLLLNASAFAATEPTNSLTSANVKTQNNEIQTIETGDTASEKLTSFDSTKDHLWAYSSEGREVFNVVTDKGDVIKAVDVDGFAYSGDMILGRTQDLKNYGLKVYNGDDEENSAAQKTHSTDKLGTIIYPTSGRKWPNGRVPVAFASNLGPKAVEAINYALNHWNTNTNVQFVARSNERDYIVVQGGNSCSAMIGRQGGAQYVTLAEGCGYGGAIHELGHALGFYHEQTRQDRDNYVTIYWNNIQRGMEYNFYETTANQGTSHGNYDYYSIMHYRTTAFGINNATTIWPTYSGVDTARIGNSTQLSRGDIAAANAIYGTPDGGVTQYTGYLSKTNDFQIQPNGKYFNHSGGQIEGTLTGPNNSDFDLELYQWQSNKWVKVSSSTNYASSEKITINGQDGFYYFKVLSYEGSGNYTLKIKKN